MFQKWYEEEGFASILFKKVEYKHDVTNILSRWKINFTGKT
jgi:hypothetical protein